MKVVLKNLTKIFPNKKGAGEVVAVNDFILDNLKLKNDIIVIVHGIGNGILKCRVHETLRRNKNVLQYATYYNNNGCTIVRLKI